MAGKSSTESAARFLAIRATREAALAQARVRLHEGKKAAAEARLAERAARMLVDPVWRFVAAHAPEAVLAWERDVRFDAGGFILGTTGRPSTALAIDRRCYEPGHAGCRCMRFREGRWLPACHPPIALSREGFQVLAAGMGRETVK